MAKVKQLKTTVKQIHQLLTDPANVRKHPTKNIDAIKGSLSRWGQQKPIVISNSNVVVAGNGVYQAAKELGWKSIVVVETDLENAEATAFAIADNKIAEMSAWDEDALTRQLQSLEAENSELAFTTGFSEEEVQQLIKDLEGDEVSDTLLESLADTFDKADKAEAGKVYIFANGSRLVVADLLKDIDVWRPLFTKQIELLVPYPSILAPFSDKYKDTVCLFVQPISRAATVTMEYANKSYPELVMSNG